MKESLGVSCWYLVPLYLLPYLMYVGVEFDELGGGGVSLVNNKWLTPRKSEVWWPPLKNQERFNKAVQKGDTPRDDWKLYKIKRCFFNEDDFSKAHKKLKLCEVMSDIQTSDFEEDDNPKKRVKQRPQRLIESSDEDESLTPRPPDILTKEYTPSSYSSRNTFIGPLSTNCSQNVVSAPMVVAPSTSKDVHIAHSAGLSTYIDKNDKMISLLMFIKEQNVQILNLLKKNQNMSDNINFNKDDLPFNLPIQSVDEVISIERMLESVEHFNTLVNYLSRLGGKNLTSKCNNMMRHLMSNKVAKHYSFFGSRQNKNGFCDLQLKNVVLKALHLTCKNVSDEDAYTSLKSWLKHAPRRDSNEEKSKRKRCEENTEQN